MRAALYSIFGSCLLVAGIYFLPPWVAELTAQGLARGIAVLGVFVLWRCGLASFGHALYFGVSAYVAVFLELKFGSTDLFLRVLAGVLVAGLLGYGIGFFLRRYRGIAFAMLNLAVSMMFFGLIIRSSAFGSTDGFVLSRTTLFGATPSKTTMIMILAALTCALIILVTAYVKSSAGYLATAIKNNELRLAFLGCSGEAAIHAKYTASAALCGIGGAFAASLLGQVDPDSMVNWYISGEFVLIAVLAGTSSAVAPIVVAIGFELMRSLMLGVAPYAWQLLFGLCLVGAVLWRPNGLWPLIPGRTVTKERG